MITIFSVFDYHLVSQQQRPNWAQNKTAAENEEEKVDEDGRAFSCLLSESCSIACAAGRISIYPLFTFLYLVHSFACRSSVQNVLQKTFANNKQRTSQRTSSYRPNKTKTIQRQMNLRCLSAPPFLHSPLLSSLGSSQN